jgi:hypothetical protein
MAERPLLVACDRAENALFGSLGLEPLVVTGAVRPAAPARRRSC